MHPCPIMPSSPLCVTKVRCWCNYVNSGFLANSAILLSMDIITLVFTCQTWVQIRAVPDRIFIQSFFVPAPVFWQSSQWYPPIFVNEWHISSKWTGTSKRHWRLCTSVSVLLKGIIEVWPPIRTTDGTFRENNREFKRKRLQLQRKLHIKIALR